MKHQKHYLNLCFDLNCAPDFFSANKQFKMGIIGLKHGDFVVQFPTVKKAVKAVKSYKEWLTYRYGVKDSKCYANAPYYVDIGNYSLPAAQASKAENELYHYWEY